MFLILLGAPGAGKGTQARFIRDRYELPVLSTGNLLREAIMAGGPEGEYYKSVIDNGSLVPDEVVLKLVRDVLSKPECQRGVVFDGFPRTLEQARALDDIVKLDAVISIEVRDEVIINRMVGRRTCPNCQRTYHLEDNPPKVGGICNSCGSILGIRDDDKPEVIKHRLQVYHTRTEPIKKYYKDKDLLTQLDGEGSVEDTRDKVFKALEGVL